MEDARMYGYSVNGICMGVSMRSEEWHAWVYRGTCMHGIGEVVTLGIIPPQQPL